MTLQERYDTLIATMQKPVDFTKLECFQTAMGLLSVWLQLEKTPDLDPRLHPALLKSARLMFKGEVDKAYFALYGKQCGQACSAGLPSLGRRR
jgi:hypothetical protein